MDSEDASSIDDHVQDRKGLIDHIVGKYVVHGKDHAVCDETFVLTILQFASMCCRWLELKGGRFI